MSWSVERLRDAASCESLIREANRFIAEAYSRANTAARRCYVYEFDAIETFAFALHCPGSPETRHLPGFGLDEIPAQLAEVTCEVADRLSLKRGRVLFNVGRYFAHCGAISPHFDGELFEYTVDPGVGNEVRRGVRPREVAILTLRDATVAGGTRLHDEAGNVIQPPMGQGDLLRFDNRAYMHSVPDPVPADESREEPSRPRWIRYTLGWRAYEEGCFDWRDGQPLRPVEFEEAIALHEGFLAEDWPDQRERDLARATFPFPERYR